jgi:hypothetical protein
VRETITPISAAAQQGRCAEGIDGEDVHTQRPSYADSRVSIVVVSGSLFTIDGESRYCK